MRFFFDRNMAPQLARMVDVLEREHTDRSYYDDDRFADYSSNIAGDFHNSVSRQRERANCCIPAELVPKWIIR
jgi:GH25 family lysozyme M1 (1,4-beta-N-acetylmuramidase)